MKNIITLVGLLFVSTLSFAQGFTDLQILYADENYDKLVREAEKYTEADKTKYEPEPYFWAARGLYKLSLSGTTDEAYKNAYKDAITFLSKGMKYDFKNNDGAKTEENQEFVDEFQLSLATRIGNDISEGAYKKAYAWCVKYQKISQEGCGIQFVIGACKYNDNDKSSARTAWVEAEKLLNDVSGVDDWNAANRMILKMGLLQTAKTYKDMRQMDKAKETLNKGAQWFESDDDWSQAYDEIVNG